MEKSSFRYWFNHWKAYQRTAIQLKVWKPRFLFHDWEKPWLKLFMPYEKVRKIHRRFARHHLDTSRKTIDHLGAVIDWECGKFKPNETMDARGYYNYCCENNKWKNLLDKYIILNLLNQLGL